MIARQKLMENKLKTDLEQYQRSMDANFNRKLQAVEEKYQNHR
jgi:hypothetical protein